MHSKPCLKQLIDIQGVVLEEYNYLEDLINPALFPQWNESAFPKTDRIYQQVAGTKYPFSQETDAVKIQIPNTLNIFTPFSPPVFCLWGFYGGFCLVFRRQEQTKQTDD